MPQRLLHSAFLPAQTGTRRLARTGLTGLTGLLTALLLLLPTLAAPAFGGEAKPKPIRPMPPPPPPVPVAERMHPGLPRFQMAGGRLILPCVLVEPGSQGSAPKPGETAPPSPYLAAYRGELQFDPQTKTFAIVQVAPVMDVNSNPACLGNPPAPGSEAPKHQKKAKHP